MVTHDYRVEARLQPPAIEAERRYLLTEMELAKREMEKLPARSWLFFSAPKLGLLRRSDWRKYTRILEHYGHELDRLEEDMADGLTPLQFDVIHISTESDSRVKVHLSVEHGTIHSTRKMPARPHRIDGAPNKSNRTKFRGFTGFVRSGIRIKPRSLEAEFSKLGDYDSALVVMQVLYVEIGQFTKIKYEIRSRHVPDGVMGEVELN